MTTPTIHGPSDPAAAVVDIDALRYVAVEALLADLPCFDEDEEPCDLLVRAWRSLVAFDPSAPNQLSYERSLWPDDPNRQTFIDRLAFAAGLAPLRHAG